MSTEKITRCKHCRERIELINFTLGQKWMHWPSLWGNYSTGEKYEYCRGYRAEPESVAPVSPREGTQADD